MADYKAASIAGTEPTISSLHKLLLSSSFGVSLQRYVLNEKTQNRSFFEVLQHRLATIPEHELERIKRIEQQEGTRLDVTHPPTMYRMQLLQAHPVKRPRVALSAQEWAQIDEEIAPVAGKLQKKLVDAFRASRYY